MAKEEGMSIFLDVFRRADKNDDGALSLAEFKSFFADGIVGNQELEDLFHEIDTHNTNNLDTGELCAYFSKHLGAFKEIFSALDVLNGSVSKALNETAQEYPKAGIRDQFATRFLLREILNQFQALHRPVDAASDHLDSNAQKEKGGSALSGDDLSKPSSAVVPGRIGRRARKQLSTQTSWTVEGGGGVAFGAQVARLQALVDRLENKVNIGGVTDEQLDISAEQMMVIVRRKFVVLENQDKAFRNALRTYVEDTNRNEDSEHVHVRSYSGTNVFLVYEIWSDDEAWKIHMMSPSSKDFQHSNIDCLEKPEDCSCMPVPSVWFNTRESSV